ncbi:MAG: PEP-CTERM sorting domain-containing protein [Planctomycetota bacterium]
MKTFALIAIAGVASSATAQDLCILVDDSDGDGEWTITAEFLGTPPSDLVQAWADASFVLAGDDAITINSFNPSYNTSLGPATITDNGTNTVGFVGNANSFFGTPDATNPLAVADFSYAGSFEALSLTLVGQNSAIFVLPPFGDVRLYQDAQGNAGTLSFEVKVVPAPASAALLGLGGLAAARRRR